uniref:Uncharacterized protein n=1 Tax=Pediastrum duplex TaxID=3105 RepID=A0A2U8GI45_PEDDU|nr:hypothetical protein [Pediastrum duplex]
MFGSALRFFFDASFASLASAEPMRRLLSLLLVPRSRKHFSEAEEEVKSLRRARSRAKKRRQGSGRFLLLRSRFSSVTLRRSRGAPKSQGTPSEDSRLNRRSEEPREAKKRTKAKKQKSQNNKVPKLYINDGTQLE